MLVLFLQTQSSEVNMVDVGGPSWSLSYETEMNTIGPGVVLAAATDLPVQTGSTIGRPVSAMVASSTTEIGIAGILSIIMAGLVVTSVIAWLRSTTSPGAVLRPWTNVSYLTRRISERFGAPMRRPTTA
jgi:hypothetical protein